MDVLNYKLVTADELAEIKSCPAEAITQQSSFTFSIQRDDSSHASYVDYLDLTSNFEHKFVHSEGENFY